MNIRTFVAKSHTFVANPQYNFPKMRGGGSKAVWKFSENSSVFGCVRHPFTQIVNTLSDNILVEENLEQRCVL